MHLIFYAHPITNIYHFLGVLNLDMFFVRNAYIVSGLCNLFSFRNIQTLHNDCPYIEHVSLFCANKIDMFIF